MNEEEQKQYDEAMQFLRDFLEKCEEGYWSKTKEALTLLAIITSQAMTNS